MTDAVTVDFRQRRTPPLLGTEAPARWRLPAIVGAITLVGLLLRLPSFGDSLFGDEIGAYWILTGRSLSSVIHLLSGHSTELNPPLWFVLAWASEKIFGASAESMKLVSLLAGTATIPLTYVLGRLTVGLRAGLLASALVALDPFLIFYSTEARPYALLVLLSVLSTVALLRGLETGARKWWLLYAIFACGVAYTHFTGVFVLVGQFLWALIAHPGARRALLGSTAAAAVGFLPWLANLIDTTGSPGTKLYGQLELFDWRAIHVDLGRWAIGHPFFGQTVVPGRVGALLILGGLLVGALGAALTVASGTGVGVRDRLQPTAGLVLMAVLACATPVGDALYSAVRESIWGSRNLLASSPGLAVLVATILMPARAPLRHAAIALVIAGLAIGALRLSERAHQRPDYRSAAAFIDRDDRGTAPVVDVISLTPGPPAATESALALDRPSQRRPVFRLGLPPIGAVERAAPYARLPVPSGEAIARQAGALAGGGRLFVVAPFRLSIDQVEAIRREHIHSNVWPFGLFGSFLGALASRFHPVAARSFSGFAPVTVYIYKG